MNNYKKNHNKMKKKKTQQMDKKYKHKALQHIFYRCAYLLELVFIKSPLYDVCGKTFRIIFSLKK